MIEENQNVANHLNRLVSFYKIAGETNKATSFAKAAATILAMEESVQGYDFWKNKIPGIGGSTIKEISEYLKWGTTERMKDLESKHATRNPDLAGLQTIPGVGIMKALELWKKYGVADVIEAIKAAQNGRIPDEELKKNILSMAIQQDTLVYSDVIIAAQDLCNAVGKINGYAHTQFVGSIRRKIETLTEIEILSTIEDGDLIQVLSSRDIDKIEWVDQSHARFNLPIGDKSITTSIYLTTPEEYYTGLLYRTGPKSFIKAIQSFAKERGWKMNEHRLLLISDPKISRHMPTEELLFRFLGLEYVAPEDRVDETSIKKI
ncbi:DNA polymerase family X protein [Rhizobium phage RHph_TM39]|nr:DNA polymerase family X protein [Rhizobium phage RHph_TM39]QIG77637.1 DNA polymerase family X protein [Rhizobium phage RHph_TM61]